jgi:2'-5' RNA ligase
MPERLFFALWPSDQVRRELESLIEDLPPYRGRAQHADDLHITLFFLGEVEADTRACAEAVAGRIMGRPFDLVLDQVGYWPRPRILWCGSSQVPGPLADLVGDLGEGLRGCGFRPERRPYFPHVTLARRAGGAAASNLARPVVWSVREFVLSISDPRLTPHYRVLGRWPLDS